MTLETARKTAPATAGKRNPWTIRGVGRYLPVGVLLLGLTGCTTLSESADPQAPGKVTQAAFVSESAQLAEKGIAAIQQGDYDEASTLFNLALKLDTTNSYLQFFNGLAYHLRAIRGDVSLYPMAQQGYELALKFDRGNWLAQYHLGMLHMEQRDFSQARQNLAEAALFNRDDHDILYNLAVASYYAQDLKTAAGILGHLRDTYPHGAKTLRASSVVMAALGDGEQADTYFNQFKAVSANETQSDFLSRRLKDWRRFHDRAGAAEAPGTQVAQMPVSPGAYPTAPVDTMTMPMGDSAMPPTEETPRYDPAALPADERAGAEMSSSASDDPHKMVIVDVVIIRTEEDLTTSKGVNLLNGLTLQFGTTDESSSGFAFKSAASKAVGNVTSTITKAINIKSINYSLNIANSNTARSEILARPTLVAMSGEQSVFFSGVEVDAAAIGGSNSDGSTVSVQKEIGVKLALTPNFLDDGRIKLNVTAERTFLTTPNTTSVTFSLRIDTSKTTVNANVALNVGETLILSGLSEKETERTRDGVPLLQDIPGVQYLFSKRTTRDFQKSVLILITPRLPNYVYRPDEARKKAFDKMSPSEQALNEFQARYSDWFRPYPNWASVFHHMQDNQLYREFRTGDVSLERWASQSALKERLQQALEFLYF